MALDYFAQSGHRSAFDACRVAQLENPSHLGARCRRNRDQDHLDTVSGRQRPDRIPTLPAPSRLRRAYPAARQDRPQSPPHDRPASSCCESRAAAPCLLHPRRRSASVSQFPGFATDPMSLRGQYAPPVSARLSEGSKSSGRADKWSAEIRPGRKQESGRRLQPKQPDWQTRAEPGPPRIRSAISRGQVWQSGRPPP